MELWKLFVLGIVIGSNNLAVAFALGSLNIRSYWWRIILTFGSFEFFIPLVGILIGRQFSNYIADYASYVGGSLLLLIGLLIIWSALSKEDDNEKQLLKKITSWTGIISISASMSLDNLVVGFSIGLQDIHPLTCASVIATSSILFTIFGLNVGKYLKKKFRVWTEIGAALLLLIIGLSTLMEWI